MDYLAKELIDNALNGKELSQTAKDIGPVPIVGETYPSDAGERLSFYLSYVPVRLAGWRMVVGSADYPSEPMAPPEFSVESDDKPCSLEEWDAKVDALLAEMEQYGETE